ncbi:MAG TPA: hypothetical protein VGQ57_14930, partial [Polyangiaceae bacterium]|nr:hypothetical protein [Polyangiaceae bacterium]
VSSNQFAKNITVADAVAQSWLTQLSIDGRLWTGLPTPGLGNTQWLSTASGAWQLPTYNAAMGFGAQFDAFGAPVGAGGSGFFCVHVRLTPLFTGASALDASGNGIMRSEVRVFWPRDGVSRLAGDCVNPGAGTVAAVGAATNLYHFVYHASTVRQPKI